MGRAAASNRGSRRDRVAGKVVALPGQEKRSWSDPGSAEGHL